MLSCAEVGKVDRLIVHIRNAFDQLASGLFLIFGSVVWVTNKISDINIERQKKDSEAKRQSKSDQKKKDSEAQNSESNDGRGLHNSNRPTSLV
jgi:hypothetical protein